VVLILSNHWIYAAAVIETVAVQARNGFSTPSLYSPLLLLPVMLQSIYMVPSSHHFGGKPPLLIRIKK
jgi:hypothetical protein